MDKKAVRDLFPVTRNLIYFNHAAVGPLSTRAAEAMERHVRDQRDHGALHWKEWYAEDAQLRASAARLIGADPGEIAILKNTSEGLSFVAVGPTIENIERLVDARTRIVSVSSVAFHNGFVADLDAIGDLCAQRDVLFCVDAIQSVGVLPIDVRKA